MNHCGRKPIYTSVTAITKDNIADVLNKALPIHQQNAADIRYLMEYEKGRQPILDRVKNVRPEINNKAVENHATEITSFKVGYVFGSPVSYTQRAARDSRQSPEETDNRNITALNEMMFEEGKSSLDQRLARDFCICGVGYRGVFAKKHRTDELSPFDLLPLNPKTTFVIRSADPYHRILLGVTYYKDDEDIYHYDCYTDTLYFEMRGDNVLTVEHKPVRTELNGIGMVPIVEYINDPDRMGCFERVLSLLDSLNECTSDRLNGLAQFIQSFIWANNVELPEDAQEKLKDGGILCTKNVDGTNAVTIEYLTAALNQTETQTLADNLYDQILQIAGVPGRDSTDSDTGQAVLLRNGWQIAETAARASEQMFCEGERQLLRIVLQILRRSGSEYAGMALSDIDIKFSRNRTDGLQTKAQALQMLLSSGIHPQRAIEIIGLWSDPQGVYNDSVPYLAKWVYDPDAESTEEESEEIANEEYVTDEQDGV